MGPHTIYGRYAFGLIAVYAALLFTARHAIQARRSTPLANALSFLYREYEPWAYWWELCEMSRRLVLVGIFVLAQRGSLMQLVYGTIFSASYILLQIQAQPHLAWLCRAPRPWLSYLTEMDGRTSSMHIVHVHVHGHVHVHVSYGNRL